MKLKHAIIVSVLTSVATTQAWSTSMQPAENLLNKERLIYAQEIIEKYGDKISQDTQRAMLCQQITLGIPPYESYLAGGASTFSVQADPEVWPTNSDPYIVIQAQSLHPDKSLISFVFENVTQFPERGLTKFRVDFVDGRASAISIMPK